MPLALVFTVCLPSFTRASFSRLPLESCTVTERDPRGLGVFSFGVGSDVAGVAGVGVVGAVVVGVADLLDLDVAAGVVVRGASVDGLGVGLGLGVGVGVVVPLFSVYVALGSEPLNTLEPDVLSISEPDAIDTVADPADATLKLTVAMACLPDWAVVAAQAKLTVVAV